ncbi:MAG: S41 family peptidase [Actinomycetota bacterium]|jgi:carboxyl-terminal processing protease|nr:S41 family peptidase [Actinomycetota bacterium]
MLTRITATACALVFVAGVAQAAYSRGLADADGASAAVSADSGRRLGVVGEVLEQLDADAVKAPDDDKLVDGAVDGMLRALDDPYAQYFDSDEFAEFSDALDGEFSGVGLVLEEGPQGVRIVSVLDGTPAAEAGITEGERIVSVDGSDVSDKPINVIVERVKGEAGTDVTLGLAGGPRGRHEVTLTRRQIDAPNIEARQLEDGTGYVRLLQFTGGVGDAVRREVEQLVAEGASGIVLDLRGNPGGLLPEAISVASIFIEDGPIVSVQERDAERRTYPARGDALAQLPVVVVVDKGSASASEIVAGAVQDSGRGDIVGTSTFGKGTVQTIQTLDNGGGVKFTTAEYFTPSGDSIEGVGVQPDQVVRGEDAQLAAAQRTLQAAVARANGG